ncbi:MAG: hypothetical protein K6D37_02540 [Prevotella sp.]|nr:hypothetical protein [Prevotella sp.]
MRKTTILSIAAFLLPATTRAQLVVDYIDNRVCIGTEAENFVPRLMVGDHSLFEGNSISIGLAATPEVKITPEKAAVLAQVFRTDLLTQPGSTRAGEASKRVSTVYAWRTEEIGRQSALF